MKLPCLIVYLFLRVGAVLSASNLNIGAILPLSGEYEVQGNFYKLGYEMARDEFVAENGQVKGLDVKLNFFDSLSDPSITRDLTQEYLNNYTNGLILGTYTSEATREQAALVKDSESSIVLSGGAADSNIFEDNDYAFGLLSSNRELGLTTIQYVHQLADAGNVNQSSKNNKVNVVLLYENSSHGMEYADAVIEYLNNNTDLFSLVYQKEFPYNEFNESRQFKYIYEEMNNNGLLADLEEANVLLVDAHSNDFVLMHNQMTEYDYDFEFISYGSRGADYEDLSQLDYPDTAAQLISGVWWSPGVENINSAKWINDWRTKQAELWFEKLEKLDDSSDEKIFALPEEQLSPSWYAALAYETARILLSAVENADSLDIDDIKRSIKTLKDTESILPGGTINFNSIGVKENGWAIVQNQKEQPLVVLLPNEEKNGNFTRSESFLIHRPLCTTNDYSYRIETCDDSNKRSVEFFWLGRYGDPCVYADGEDSSGSCWCDEDGLETLPEDFLTNCEMINSSSSVGLSVKVLAGLSTGICFIALIWVIFNKTHPLVAHGGWSLDALICMSATWISLSTLLLIGTASTPLCQAQATNITFSVSFLIAALLSKAYRSKKFWKPADEISSRSFFKPLVISMLISIIIVATWMGVYPPRAGIVDTDIEDKPVVLQANMCMYWPTNSNAVLMVLILFFGCQIIVTNFFAFNSRELDPHFHTTKHFFWASFTLGVVGFMLVALTFIAGLDISQSLIMLAVALNCSTVLVIMFLIFPKMYKSFSRSLEEFDVMDEVHLPKPSVESRRGHDKSGKMNNRTQTGLIKE